MHPKSVFSAPMDRGLRSAGPHDQQKRDINRTPRALTLITSSSPPAFPSPRHHFHPNHQTTPHSSSWLHSRIIRSTHSNTFTQIQSRLQRWPTFSLLMTEGVIPLSTSMISKALSAAGLPIRQVTRTGMRMGMATGTGTVRSRSRSHTRSLMKILMRTFHSSRTRVGFSRLSLMS